MPTLTCKGCYCQEFEFMPRLKVESFIIAIPLIDQNLIALLNLFQQCSSRPHLHRQLRYQPPQSLIGARQMLYMYCVPKSEQKITFPWCMSTLALLHHSLGLPPASILLPSQGSSQSAERAADSESLCHCRHLIMDGCILQL